MAVQVYALQNSFDFSFYFVYMQLYTVLDKMKKKLTQTTSFAYFLFFGTPIVPLLFAGTIHF